jgi:hypothetical protein
VIITKNMRDHTYYVTLTHEEFSVIGASLDVSVNIVNSAPDNDEGEVQLSSLVRSMHAAWEGAAQ